MILKLIENEKFLYLFCVGWSSYSEIVLCEIHNFQLIWINNATWYNSTVYILPRFLFLSLLPDQQNSLVIDTPRVRKQTRPFSATKDELAELSEGESSGDDKPKLRRPHDRLNSYGRTECFRVEKNLLVYGWVLLFMFSFICLFQKV